MSRFSDGCSYNMKSSKGELIFKPWRIQSSCRAVTRTLNKKCSKDHRHAQLRRHGKDVRNSGFYSVPFARALVRGLLSLGGSDWAPAEVNNVDESGDEDDHVPASASLGTHTGSVAALMKAIKKLHCNLGHPSPRRLARAIRLSGGSEAALAAAMSFVCETCKRLKHPAPTNAASLGKITQEFNEKVGVDLFTLADLSGAVRTFINLVCWGTNFQIVAPCPSKRPDVVFAAFLSAWCLCFGVPRELVHDRGGEFEAEFAQGIEWLGGKLSPLPAYAPTQNAVTERAGSSWKMQARAVIEDRNIRWDQQAGIEWWLCASVNWSRNQSVGDNGYSPAQWVLGRGLQLPADLLSPMGRLDVAIRARDEPKFSDRLLLLSSAQRALAAQRSSRSLATAIAARGRGTSGIVGTYNVGDQIMYWRQTRHKKSEWASYWHGPAVVIGQEGPHLWVSHKGHVIKAAPRQCRHCTSTELADWRTIFDDARREEERRTAQARESCGLPAEEERNSTNQTRQGARSRSEEEQAGSGGAGGTGGAGSGSMDVVDSQEPQDAELPQAKKRRTFQDLASTATHSATSRGASSGIPPPPPGSPPTSTTRRWRAGMLTPAPVPASAPAALAQAPLPQEHPEPGEI